LQICYLASTDTLEYVISTCIAAILIANAGLYSVVTTGITGGPNHGEHPFTVTLVHMIAFYFFGQHWPAVLRHLYWGGLIAALVLSVIALRLAFNTNKEWRIFVRVSLGLLYAGFLVLLFKRL
jgi:hypothetical protein